MCGADEQYSFACQLTETSLAFRAKAAVVGRTSQAPHLPVSDYVWHGKAVAMV